MKKFTCHTFVSLVLVLFFAGLCVSRAGDLSVQGDLNVAANLTVSGAVVNVRNALNVASNLTANVGDVATLNVASNLFLNGTNIMDLVKSNSFSNVGGNLNMSDHRIINMADPVEAADAMNVRFFMLSLSNIPPMGDMSMGIYTNK